MVFKFERKSTEKKCEKRKNWRLLWKKIRNNINQCNYMLQSYYKKVKCGKI